MAGDRHHLGPLGGLGVEPFELVARAHIHDVRGMMLQRHQHDVVDLEIVGQRHHRPVRGLQRHRLVVEHPVADVLDARLRQVIERVEGLRQPGPEPAARPFAGEFLDHVHGAHDDGALVVDLVHRHLVEAVGVDLPAHVHAGLHHGGIGLADPCVERDCRRDIQFLQHLAQPPEADPHAVFVPAPVRVVGLLRLALRRRDHHPRHRPRHVPFLQRQHRPDHHAHAVGELQRRPALDGRVFETFTRVHGH